MDPIECHEGLPNRGRYLEEARRRSAIVKVKHYQGNVHDMGKWSHGLGLHQVDRPNGEDTRALTLSAIDQRQSRWITQPPEMAKVANRAVRAYLSRPGGN